MTKSLFEYILKYSKPQQIVLIAVTFAAFPFYYTSLELPKHIVNDAIAGQSFPVDIGFSVGPIAVDFGEFDQIPYLILLCLIFLTLVLINGAFKFFINVYRGTLGERMLRRLRYQLIERVMRFPIGHFRHTSQGELVSMVNQETEPLAGFIGESISVPLYQGGIMVTILVFMFVQDWRLGVAAIALYPFQSWLIPKLQKQVNLLNRERTKNIRTLAEKLGETVAGIQDLHSNDSTAYMKSVFSERLGRIFNIRATIFKKKFFIKFLNNVIAQITPFFFFLIGGLLVINGELSFGALVAVLNSYKDLSAPWKEMLNWYQRQADARMKYELLTEQFAPEGMLPEALQQLPAHAPADEAERDTLSGAIAAVNLGWADSDGTKEVDLVSLNIEPGERVALIGVGNSGKDTLAHMLARLVMPTTGKVMVDNRDAAHVSETMIGRTIGYLGHDAYLFSDTVLENLLVGLKHHPNSNNAPSGDGDRGDSWIEEARRSGNSEFSPSADWIDYAAIGADSAAALRARIFDVLRIADVADDLIHFALKRTIDVNKHPDLVVKLLEARQRFRVRLVEERLQTIVEPLEIDQFNSHATIGENLLFGTPIGEEYAAANLSEHQHVTAVLAELDLIGVFDDAAKRIAAILVELLTDLPPGHEFFERFSFIESDELPLLRNLLTGLEADADIEHLPAADRRLIRSLPFKVVTGRHRLDIFDESTQHKIVEARHLLAEKLPDSSRGSIEFFSAERFNAATTVEDNIMFGRIAYGRLGGAERARALMTEILDELQVLPDLLDVALHSSVGIAGSRLPLPQRQKLALARVLMKQPRVLIVNEGLSALDGESTATIMDNIVRRAPDMALFWMDNKLQFEDHFDRAIYLEGGKIVQTRDLASERTVEEDGEPAPTRAIRSAASLADNEKVTMLQAIPMFRHLDTNSLKLLAEACETLDFKAGENLFRQGDVGDALYVIVDGEAAVVIENKGAKRRVSTRRNKDVIGEVALLSLAPRTATIEAITDLATLKLSKEPFMDLLQSNGEIGYQILQLMAARLTELSQQLEQSLSDRDVKAA